MTASGIIKFKPEKTHVLEVVKKEQSIIKNNNCDK